MSSTCFPGSQAFLQQRLEKELTRLDRQTAGLLVGDRRLSAYRIGVFAAGVVACALALTTGSQALFNVALLASIAVFGIVVYLHRRVDSQLARRAAYRLIKAGQLARLRLDWDNIRLTSAVTPASPSLALDLDLTGPRSLHQLIDLSVSPQGSQRLADWLTQSQPDPQEIASRQAVVQELARVSRFRDRLLLDFNLVSKQPLEGQRLVQWLSTPLPLDRLRWLLPVSSLFVFSNLALFVLNLMGVLPELWPFTTLLYLGFYYYNANLLGEFLGSVVELDAELRKFEPLLRRLEEYPYRNCEALAALCTPFRDPANLPSHQIRSIRRVTAGVGLRSNPIIGMLINLVLPWDFIFAWLAGNLRARAARFLPLWLETWTRLEALLSLANFAHLNPQYGFPEIDPASQPVFEAKGLGHPLLAPDKRVCNDFRLSNLGEVVLVTGSNMAGKSTFIKTIGVNLALAYAGGPVCAQTFYTQPFRLHTCIRITDSIADGFSYFYAEVRCLKALLDALRLPASTPLLYLIDEIFRGTNNRERLAGSQAYLRALVGGSGVGWIATHDLELAHLAESDPRIHNFHFTDRIEDGRLAFDYQILPGPSPTTNALKIMALEGLPVDQTDDLPPADQA